MRRLPVYQLARYAQQSYTAGPRDLPRENREGAKVRGTRKHKIGDGKPETWGECKTRGLGITKPCGYVSCGHHLAIDVNENNGAVRYNFPGVEVDEMPETCALAVVEKHGAQDMGKVGVILGVVREAISQTTQRAIAKIGEARWRELVADCATSLPDYRTRESVAADIGCDRVVRLRVVPPPAVAQDRPVLDARGRILVAAMMRATSPRTWERKKTA